MWSTSYSKLIKNATKEAIWQRWSDVDRWPEWVPNIEHCKLEEPFAAGSHFILKPKGASPMTVELAEVKKGRKFIGRTRFFGATLYDIHEMRPDPHGIRLTVTLKIIGPLSFLWRKLVGETIEANLPKLINNLAHLASASAEKKKSPPLKESAPASKIPDLQPHASAPPQKRVHPSAAISSPSSPHPQTSEPPTAKTKSRAAAPKNDKPKLKMTASKKTKSPASAVKKVKPASRGTAHQQAKSKAAPSKEGKTASKTGTPKKRGPKG